MPVLKGNLQSPGPLPTTERYDGINFHMLQKAKREGYLSKNLDILILSTKYGLPETNPPIENYDLKVTEYREKELQKTVK